MTRTGKIARLPQHVRQTLNQRLQEGEIGRKLVAWLNGLEAAREVLTAQFDGRPISEQNLSEWKQGGYRDWERQQERLALVTRLAEEAEELDEATDGRPVSHLLANTLATELARTAGDLLRKETDPRSRLRQLRALLHELTELRREDRKAIRAMRDLELWEQEDERKAERQLEQETAKSNQRLKGKIFAALKTPLMAEAYGGGEFGWKAAAFLNEIEYDLPSGSLADHPPPRFQSRAPTGPDQTKSNQIKPELGPGGTSTGAPRRDPNDSAP